MHEDGSQAEEEPADSSGKPPAGEVRTSADQQEGRQAGDEGAASEEAAKQADAAVDLDDAAVEIDDDDIIDLVNVASPQQAKKRR